MQILLLGSSGALGTAIETVCKKQNINCIPVDHSDLEATLLNDLMRVVNHTNPDTIINAIGIPRIQTCEDSPIQAFATNTIIPSYLTRICREKNIILVHPSTNAVFDGLTQRFYIETSEPNPLQDYGISKLAGEHFVRTWEKHYIFRFPSTYGDRRNSSKGLIDEILSWLEGGKPVKIATDRIDSYTWTMDAAKIVILILTKKLPFGLYHIANDGQTSLFNFVCKIRDTLKLSNTILTAKDADFPCTTLKPLRNPLRSNYLQQLRSWDEALKEYLHGRLLQKNKQQM